MATSVLAADISGSILGEMTAVSLYAGGGGGAVADIESLDATGLVYCGIGCGTGASSTAFRD